MMNESAAAQPAASVPPSLPPSVGTLAALDHRVSKLRFHIAAWRFLYGAECYLALALAALVLLAFVDQLISLDQETVRRFGMWWWSIAAVGAGVWAWRVTRLTPHRAQLALHLEARDRSYAGYLLTAIEAIERPAEVPHAVADVAGEHAWKIMQRMPIRTVCPLLPWRRAHAGMMGTLALLFLGLGLFGFNFGRSIRDALFPGPSASSISAQLRFLEIRPGHAEVAEGETLKVEVVCEGAVGGPMILEMRERHDRATQDLKMGVQGDQVYEGSLANLRRPCEYRVVAYSNDSALRRHAPALRSSWFAIGMRPAQAFRSIAILVEPPEYTQRKPFWLRDPELIEAPTGSQMTMLVRAVPASRLADGNVELPGGQQVSMDRLQDETRVALFRLRFCAERSGVLRIGLNARQEDQPDIQTLVPVSLIGDAPPEVVARIPDGAAAGVEGLPVNLKARDDYGLSAARLLVRRLRDGLEQSAEANVETPFEIPVAAGTRTVDEQWFIPADGLGEWLTLGFEYRLEAQDNAPQHQTAQSDWVRYEPLKRSQARGEREGLFDPPAKRRPRQLARSNALSDLPNPTPDELAQMKGLGDGVESPRQLRRPQAERLDDGKQANHAGGASGQQGSAQPAPQDGDRYDLPQGLPQEKQPKPPEGPGEANGVGGPGPSPQEGQPEPRSGQRGSGDGPKQQDGQANPDDGRRTEDGGAEEDPGGAVGASQTQPGSGPGGRNQRDGGQKTGRESQPGSAPMAAPDLETLARMKGFTAEEAAEYARKHSVEMPGSSFGTRSGRGPRAGEVGIQQEMARLTLREPDRSVSDTPVTGRGKTADGVLRLSWDQIDPLYQPCVEGYFRRWQDWKGR